ncbi:fibronectin type III domain-containing protein [Flavobacterium sp. 3HN19-14]|uniref:fibronectin type III domain-containing protein n=1 Tax=Flavobacterium sp. 3HN19-14 TaxID=3448133 RepID=UPI003EE2C7FF
MKNIKLFTALFVMLSALSFTSCETEIEPIDPAVLDPILTGCTKPTSFHVSDFVEGNTIILNWVEGGQESSWEIEYGTPGFTLGSGTTLLAEENTISIGGLNPDIAYEFYIRGVCSEEMKSAWVGPLVSMLQV